MLPQAQPGPRQGEGLSGAHEFETFAQGQFPGVGTECTGK